MSKKHTGKMTGDPVTFQIPSPAGGVRMETFIPWTLVKRGVRREVITPLDVPQAFEEEKKKAIEERKADQESPLVRAIGLALYWQQLLDEGRFKSMTDIARAENIDPARMSRISQLAYLAPNIIERLLSAEQQSLTLESLIQKGIPREWSSQIETFFS